MSLPKKPDKRLYTKSQLLIAERDYYKAVAEFAIGVLEDIARREDEGREFANNPAKYGGVSTLAIDLSGKARLSLEAIRQTEQADQKPL